MGVSFLLTVIWPNLDDIDCGQVEDWPQKVSYICHEKSEFFFTIFFSLLFSVEAMNFERPLVTDMNVSAGGPRFNGWASSRGDQDEDTMEVNLYIL